VRVSVELHNLRLITSVLVPLNITAAFADASQLRTHISGFVSLQTGATNCRIHM